ncbi:hypothetical protein ABH899_001067 [Paenibacillus sp. RC84]
MSVRKRTEVRLSEAMLPQGPYSVKRKTQTGELRRVMPRFRFVPSAGKRKLKKHSHGVLFITLGGRQLSAPHVD